LLLAVLAVENLEEAGVLAVIAQAQ